MILNKLRTKSGQMVTGTAVAKVMKLRPSRKPRTPRHRGQMIALEPGELVRLLKAARERSIRDWTMLLVAYCHGLRASEVCNLRMEDIHLRAGTIRCRRLKGSLESIQALSPHRGNKLLDEVHALRAWLKVRKDDQSGFLFLSSKGGRLSRIQFFRLFQKYAELAGLPLSKQHPHVLKHSLASHMVAENVNLAKVQVALGHRAISSTMKYVAVSREQADEARMETFMTIFEGA